MAGSQGSSGFLGKGYSKHGYPVSIRQDVFSELSKNPLLTPKPLAKILGLPWPKYKNYIARLKTEWRSNHGSELRSSGSLPDEVHRCFFVGVVPLGLDRVVAVGRGWLRTRSRNRFLLWRVRGLGRIRWFETGNVELYVRKPATDERLLRLFCCGFTRNGLIVDADVIKRCVDSLRVQGGKATWYTPERLPYLRIPLFRDSNGVEFVMGDKSDPRGVHVIFRYQEQLQRFDRFFEAFEGFFGLHNGDGVGKEKGKGEDYIT